MSAQVQYSEFGGPEVLSFVEVPMPSAPSDGVVVETRAIGVNPIDSMLRSGARSSAPLRSPRVPGADAAGVVVAVGADVDDWVVGDEVVVQNGHSTYATHIVAPASRLVRKPAGVGWDEAAAIGVPASTAYQALRTLGVEVGSVVLIHAGSGAVGQAAIQFARNWGATVIATGGERNQARMGELGAIPVEYGPGLLQNIRAAAPGPIDVVLDAAGTDEALEASFALVSDRSHIGTVVVGARAAELGIQAWSGGNPLPLTPEELRLRAESYAVTLELIELGDFEVEIGARYPLTAAAEAQRASMSGEHRGKIILHPSA
ncbi:NADP-dependent oxidoreductase [Herbiconiux sp. CPCC 205763]|uniref:NADP-dependent oxidoreductase n=1 Tax=Herbiconiux aconitum TaxID=2970913 RepID=A0ABT2GR31_9MICO|nr:NADP-dependent oxidoreductase [Herbiconiux aconitum]MCS5717241.1 NADP-dependent oxidoreductase [Herbiconiux aconitum]